MREEGEASTGAGKKCHEKGQERETAVYNPPVSRLLGWGRGRGVWREADLGIVGRADIALMFFPLSLSEKNLIGNKLIFPKSSMFFRVFHDSI